MPGSAPSLGVPIGICDPTMQANAYLLPVEPRGHCVLIDPGLDPEAIERALCEYALHPVAVFCTHGHFDHAGSSGRFQREYGIPVVLHEAEKPMLRMAQFMAMAFKIGIRLELPAEVSWVCGGQNTVEVGADHVEWVHTPGHSPGSCTIFHGGVAFTGDTLFCRGIGLSRLPGQDERVLRRSVGELLEVLPADCRIFPGHGQDALRGELLESNPELAAWLLSTSDLCGERAEAGS
jgi:hydroxyacylglutathione hydrolase